MQRSRMLRSTCSIIPPRCSGASVERAREGVREVRFVDHALLVQRLDHDDVRRGEAGQRLEQRIELLSSSAVVGCSARQSVASSTSTLTGLAM